MRRPSAWSLWQLPKLAIGLVLAVDVAALAPLALLGSTPSAAELTLALFLATLSIAYSALTCSLERARTALRAGTEPASYRNLLTSWTFVAAVISPAPLIVGVILVSAIAEWPVRKLAGQAKLYRHVYSTAAVVPAALAARVITGISLPFCVTLPLGAVVYVVVNSLLFAAAVVAVGQAGSVRVLLRLSTYKYEVATLAVALAEVELFRLDQVPMMWLSLAATIAIQRLAVRSEFREVCRPDARPMSEEAWLIAATEIIPALPVAAILRVNAASTEAAAEVARLQAGCDAIGYLGSSGLAMVLLDCPARSADALASRLRMALRHNGIDASVASAAKPRDGHTLVELAAVCEAELITRDALRDQSPKWNP